MKRSLTGIQPVPSSHKVGLKHVLLSAEESGCAITQIAVTELKAGEVVEAHIHNDMQEGFYVMSGNLDIILDNETLDCSKDDFVFVKCGVKHELKAISDVRVMTTGCKM